MLTLTNDNLRAPSKMVVFNGASCQARMQHARRRTNNGGNPPNGCVQCTTFVCVTRTIFARKDDRMERSQMRARSRHSLSLSLSASRSRFRLVSVGRRSVPYTCMYVLEWYSVQIIVCWPSIGTFHRTVNVCFGYNSCDQSRGDCLSPNAYGKRVAAQLTSSCILWPTHQTQPTCPT